MSCNLFQQKTTAVLQKPLQGLTDEFVRGDLQAIKQMIAHGIEPHVDECFLVACFCGYQDVVHYLLTSREIIHAGYKNADIHYDTDKGLVYACQRGHLDIVKFLLTSPELKGNCAKIVSPAVVEACKSGHVEVVKYLCNSLRNGSCSPGPSNIDYEEAFIQACQTDNREIITFFILELNMQRTSKIRNFLQESKSCGSHYAQQMLLRKELYGQLNESMPMSAQSKRTKI